MRMIPHCKGKVGNTGGNLVGATPAGRPLPGSGTSAMTRPLIVASALALLVALGYLDRITAFEFDLFLFYALPVAMGTWWVGRAAGLLLAAGAVAVWCVANFAETNPYSTVFYAAWNTALRGGWMLLVALTLSALRDAHRGLETRVRARTAELSAAVSQLRSLTTELTLVEQRERQRLAEMLHDGLQQLLAGARLHVHSLRRADPARLPDQCDAVCALLDEAIQCSRTLTAELSPSVLHTAGFLPALEWLARWVQETHGLTVALHAAAPRPPETAAAKILLFQSVRELLFNVVKHAGVRQATVTVTGTPDQLQVVVTDQGRGFDPTQIPPPTSGGLGLSSIRQRLEFLGGRLDITSAPGQGSRFTLVVPLCPSP